MTKFVTTDQPTGRHERRHGPYSPRHIDPTGSLAAWEFLAVIGGSVLVLAAIACVASSGWVL